MAKFCSNCGSPLTDGIKFCENCGTPIHEPAVPAEPEEPAPVEPEVAEPESKPKKRRKKAASGAPVVTEKISENISLYSDGKYRWKYEMGLLKNPTVFILVWKIFFFIILAGYVIMFFSSLGVKNFFWDGFLNNLKIFGIVIGVMTGVSVLGYLLYAAMMGGKYCVNFEMDEKGILHSQTFEQAKKAKKISTLTTIAGIASHSPTTAGIGINSARTEMYSEFAKTKKVKVGKMFGVIKVNGLFSHNQVYAAKEDLEFVKNYIFEHCPNAKKK